jgi:hypothetical protein
MKKGILFLALTLVVFISVSAQSVRAQVFNDSADWMFYSSSLLTSDSGPNNHTLNNSGVTWLADPPYGSTSQGCANFSGTQTQFSTVDTMNLTPSAIVRISGWTKGSNGTAGVAYIVSDSDMNTPGAIVVYQSGAGLVAAWMADINGPYKLVIDDAFGGSNPGWVGWTAVYNQTALPADRFSLSAGGDFGVGTYPTGQNLYPFLNHPIWMGSNQDTAGHNYANELGEVKIIAQGAMAPISVTVKLGGLNSSGDYTLNPIRVLLRDSADTTTLETQNYTPASAPTLNPTTISFPTVAPGTYLVRALAGKFLSESALVTAIGGQTNTVSLTLLGGDLNCDGFVEDQDYSIMGIGWYQGGN